MHSQAELIQHLTGIREFLVQRAADVHAGEEAVEGCICYGSETTAPDGEDDPMHIAVKQMVVAEFGNLGKEYGASRYMYPVRVGTYESESNYYGTKEEVKAGREARLALIDKWIAAAHKKLLAAVFRKAIGKLESGDSFMCCAIRHAVSDLMDMGSADVFKHPLVVECLAVLNRFAPQGKQFAWFTISPQHKALRIAILNLCITEVTRGFK